MVLVVSVAAQLFAGALLQISSGPGQSAEASAAGSPPVPRAPLQRYITSDDFPAGLPRSAARPVQVALGVGPDGRAIDCRIISGSGAPSLDSATCRLLRNRARFTPARDGRGTAITGEVQATIDWNAVGQVARPTVPAGDQRITLAPWESRSRLRARFGQVASCQWETSGIAPPPPSSNACQNPALARLAMGLAVENGLNLTRTEVVITLRMTGTPGVEPSEPVSTALLDLAADLDIAADGRLAGCRFVREKIRSASPKRPDCRMIFAGPYIPVTDSRGQPKFVTKRAEMRVEAR